MTDLRLFVVSGCKACPRSSTFIDHRSIGLMCRETGRAFEREQGSAVYPEKIPDWCPLPKAKP
jgi:hypothetical protein